jgi:hypothetical protein
VKIKLSWDLGYCNFKVALVIKWFQSIKSEKYQDASTPFTPIANAIRKN